MKIARWFLVVAVAAGGAPLLPVQAQLYACPKANGVVSYVSDPTRDCKKVKSYEPQATPKPNAILPLVKSKPVITNESLAPKKRSRATGSTPAKTSTVNRQTQKQRDRKRSEVLLYELSSEQKILQHIQQQISKSATGDGERLALLKEQQQIHALNITALQQELARLGIHVDNPSN